MSFAILRVAKLKTMGNVAGHGDHVERIRDTPNADLNLKLLNNRIVGTADAAADVLERFGQVGIQPRKGAVVAIDVFISASPEHFKSNHPDDPNWKAFQERAMDFLRQEYGADNVVHAIAHHDETSPHLHAIVTPIRSKTVKVGRKIKTDRVENRLCARDWLGGDRTTLSKLQTRFADHVKNLGLSRGIEGSQAKHTEVKQFYTVMKETVSQAETIKTKLAPIDTDYFVKSVPKPGLLDIATPRQFAQTQVSNALEALRGQIEQTNQNAQIARKGQLVKLQTPVLTALAEKGQTRQSQAEAALEKLGYRLDQHGGLIDILEERKDALRATISRSLGECATLDELKVLLLTRGITLIGNKSLADVHEGQTVNAAMFRDKKGWVEGKDLGHEYTTIALRQQLASTEKRREEEKKQAAMKAEAEKTKLKTESQATKKKEIQGQKGGEGSINLPKAPQTERKQVSKNGPKVR